MSALATTSRGRVFGAHASAAPPPVRPVSHLGPGGRADLGHVRPTGLPAGPGGVERPAGLVERWGGTHRMGRRRGRGVPRVGAGRDGCDHAGLARRGRRSDLRRDRGGSHAGRLVTHWDGPDLGACLPLGHRGGFERAAAGAGLRGGTLDQGGRGRFVVGGREPASRRTHRGERWPRPSACPRRGLRPGGHGRRSAQPRDGRHPLQPVGALRRPRRGARRPGGCAGGAVGHDLGGRGQRNRHAREDRAG